MKYILLLFIGLIWGSQYLFNAIALNDISALGLASWRMFIGFITLNLMIMFIPKLKKESMKFTKKLVLLFIAIGAVEAAMPFWLIGYGQMRLDSSVVAIIMGMIPMLTLLLELIIKKDHKTSIYEILGMTLAFVGLVVLINPTADDFHGSIMGYLAVLMAALCFALALILMEKIPKEISSVHATRFILGIYSIPMLAVWMFGEGGSVSQLSNDAILSILVVGVFSSGFVYLMYLSLIRMAGPTFTSLSNYIVPLVGTFMGVWFLKENFTINIAFALVFIIVGLFIANVKKKPL